MAKYEMLCLTRALALHVWPSRSFYYDLALGSRLAHDHRTPRLVQAATCRGAANNWLEGKGEHLGGGDCMLCFRLFQAKKNDKHVHYHALPTLSDIVKNTFRCVMQGQLLALSHLVTFPYISTTQTSTKQAVA